MGQLHARWQIKEDEHVPPSVCDPYTGKQSERTEVDEAIRASSREAEQTIQRRPLVFSRRRMLMLTFVGQCGLGNIPGT